MRRARLPARIAAALAAPIALALGGCGFTPMYAEPGVGTGLQHIQVVAPQGRIGYLMGESLDDDFGHAKGQAPLYKLEMVLTEVRQAHGLSANDVAQRYEFDLKVAYSLTDLSSGKQVHTGTVFSNISYDFGDPALRRHRGGRGRAEPAGLRRRPEGRGAGRRLDGRPARQLRTA